MRAKQDHLHSIIYSALRYCIRITCTGGVYTRLHQLQSGLEGIIEQLCLIPGHVKDMKTGINKEICSELNAKNLLSWCPVNIYDILAICKKIWRTSTTLNLLSPSSKQPILAMNQWTVAGMKLLQSFSWNWISHQVLHSCVEKTQSLDLILCSQMGNVWSGATKPNKGCRFSEWICILTTTPSRGGAISTPQCQYVAANQSLRDQFLIQKRLKNTRKQKADYTSMGSLLPSNMLLQITHCI